MNVTIKSANGMNPRPYKGKTYVEQQAALETGADYPLVFRLNREEGDCYAPGVYTIDPASYVTDEHGNLHLKRVRLIAAKPAKA